MPTVSKKQEKFMQAVAHNPKFAKAAGVPQSVGKEFTKSGGGMATKKMGGFPMGQAMGKVKTAAPSRDGVAVKGKTKGKQVVMAGNKMTGKGMKYGGKC
jgi:hypothetical protein